jgi:hypothetical protein
VLRFPLIFHLPSPHGFFYPRRAGIFSPIGLTRESDRPFFHSAQEGVHFNLYLPGDIGIFVVLEHDFPCGDLSRVLGLKAALH